MVIPRVPPLITAVPFFSSTRPRALMSSVPPGSTVTPSSATVPSDTACLKASMTSSTSSRAAEQTTSISTAADAESQRLASVTVSAASQVPTWLAVKVGLATVSELRSPPTPGDRLQAKSWGAVPPLTGGASPSTVDWPKSMTRSGPGSATGTDAPSGVKVKSVITTSIGDPPAGTVPLSLDNSLTRFFEWTSDEIRFLALEGYYCPLDFPPESVIHEYVYDHDPAFDHYVPTEGREAFRFNLCGIELMV